MSVHYLVDFENVHEAGLRGLHILSAEDCVYIFHTSVNDRISLSSFDDVQAWVKVILVPPGKQSLDMHLGSFLGYLIGKEESPDNQYAIVSRDSDYRGITEFWNRSFQAHDKVQCIQGIGCTSPGTSALLPVDPEKERAAIRDCILRVFSKHGVIGLNGMPCMLVSDLCARLNAIPEYLYARKRLGKRPMQFLCEECQDILYIRKQWTQDWAYLIAAKAESSTSAAPAADEIAKGASDESVVDEDETDVMEMGDLSIDDDQLSVEAQEEEVPSDNVESVASETDNNPDELTMLTIAMECIQNAGDAERNARGHVRVSSLRDELMKLPEFRYALKESRMQPIPFIQLLFTEKIRFYREKGTWWASACSEPENIDETPGTETTGKKKKYYEQAFSNIQKQLADAGLEKEVADEIADIFMHSRSAVEPRKMIHTLLCQRYGTKIGAQYYRKAVKYVNILPS